MKYIIAVQETQMVEVDAESGDKALEILQQQILKQNPRSIAKLSLVEEAIVHEDKEITNEETVSSEDNI